MLTTSIIVLQCLLTKQKQMTGDSNIFYQERKTFFFVLWFFDISYITRAIYAEIFFRIEDRYGVERTLT